MEAHELAITALFNNYLAPVGSGILGLFNITAEHPERPWENSIVVEILVAALLMIGAAILRAGLSADNPGKLQHIAEELYGFIADLMDQVGVHHRDKYLPFVGTIFLFIMTMNLIGIIPAFESPTMSPWVPAGLALSTFFYFNYAGFREHGIKYLAQFGGPVRFENPIATAAIIIFMIPIELLSVMIRPLSLTIRLYGNMYAGEQITTTFVGLTKLVVPVAFMGLHIFVSLVQAFVFTLLATIYINMATSHEH